MVNILRRTVTKIAFPVEAGALARRVLHGGQVRFQTHLLAGLNILAFVVAAIGRHVGLANLQFGLGRLRNAGQLSLIGGGVRHFGGDQQMMFGVHSTLHIVAHHVLATGLLHRAAVRIGLGHLSFAGAGQRLQPLPNLRLLRLQPRNLFVYLGGDQGLGHRFELSVGLVKDFEVI